MSDKNNDLSEESAIITWPNKTKEWRDNKGYLHRLDGPAIEHADGSKEWLIHGKFHRIDGPAMEWSNGSKAWWIHDEFIVELKPKNK